MELKQYRTCRWVVLLALVCMAGCDGRKSEEASVYPDQFGEIDFDASLDDASFNLCDPSTLVHSRVSLNYEGGRKRIEEICKVKINRSDASYAYNGYIMIRFLVNCKGETDRFRIETMDEGFGRQDCPEGLVTLVEETVRSLDQWVVSKPENKGRDHSKYLNFKIVNGQVDGIIH